MCPILSNCSHRLDTSGIIQLGCSSSRCWAEINDQFGEPLGSFRETKFDRFGLHHCLAQTYTVTRYNHSGSEESVTTYNNSDLMKDAELRPDAGQVLAISVRKQQEQGAGHEPEDDLYRTVLINNTARAAQKEIRKSILQSLFF